MHMEKQFNSIAILSNGGRKHYQAPMTKRLGFCAEDGFCDTASGDYTGNAGDVDFPDGGNPTQGAKYQSSNIWED